MIGIALQNRYNVEKKIGQGGAATVYRAFDTKLKRPVAIKVLDPIDEDDKFKVRFMREAESMARFNHPNIVTVHDVSEYNGRPYLVMELVEGPTLLELADRSPLSLPMVCSMARQICRGMMSAHAHDVIHGDLTLKNVIVSDTEEEGPRAKILDFGLARLRHERPSTTGGGLLGTPYYLAPEQIKHQPVDNRTDVYAFGVGLYRLVNGSYPFKAQHPAALLYVILNQKRFPRAEGVPEALHALILRCLEKEPDNRPGSFADVACEIEAVDIEPRPVITAAPRSATEPVALSRRRQKNNPYLNRVMVKSPEEFFGRAAEVRRIYSRLDAPRPQSVSVVGERTIGKSSLLNYVYHRANRKQFMRNHESCIFVYLDFQSRLDYDVEMFIDFLFNMFSFECRDGYDYNNRKKSLDELRDVVAELDAEDKRIIILMDEFEVITRNERFDASFFAFLRSLANSYKVAYVTSSCEDLQKMCHNKDIADSPFFNIFSNLPLRSFEHDEALELITMPSERAGVPLRPHADRILDMAGRFPLFLQVACAGVYDYLVDNDTSDPDWDRITEVYLEDAGPYFRSVWAGLDEATRENIARIAMGKSAAKKYINTKLLRRGYLVEVDGAVKIFASPFKNFVLGESEETHSRRGMFGKLFGPKRRGKR